MGLDKFSREKNFLKLVSRRFVDSSPDTRLGLISFSDTAKLFADFVEFERMGIDQFQKILDELPYQGGRTRIDRALMAASQHLFTKRRPGVQRVSEKRRYLTIIPRARMGYWLRGYLASSNNCFSKIQLVGQTYWDKTTLARKTRFSRPCFGFQSRHFSLLVGYNI